MIGKLEAIQACGLKYHGFVGIGKLSMEPWAEEAAGVPRLDQVGAGCDKRRNPHDYGERDGDDQVDSRDELLK